MHCEASRSSRVTNSMNIKGQMIAWLEGPGHVLQRCWIPGLHQHAYTLYMPLYAFISWGSMSQITKLSGAVKVLASLHVGACFPRSPRLLPSFVSCHLRIFSSGTGPGCVGPWNCLIWIPTRTRTFLDLKSLDSGIVVGKGKSLQKLEKKKKTRKFQSRIMLSEPCWTSQESVKCLASLKLQHIQRTQKKCHYFLFCYLWFTSESLSLLLLPPSNDLIFM